MKELDDNQCKKSIKFFLNFLEHEMTLKFNFHEKPRKLFLNNKIGNNMARYEYYYDYKHITED